MADVEPWTDVFNPGVRTLDRLVELTREVDFAAFVFAQDDWTAPTPGDPGTAVPGQASPRDNVVFEAGLFGGALGMRRTFILHANGAKLPTDLLGLTCVRYDPELTPHELKTVNQKVRKAIEAEGRLARIEGALVAVLADRAQRGRALGDQPAPDLARPDRRARGQRPLVAGGRHPLGALLERGAEGAVRPGRASSTSGTASGPRHPDAPRLEGTGEIKLESDDRAPAATGRPAPTTDPQLARPDVGRLPARRRRGLGRPRLGQRRGAQGR